MKRKYKGGGKEEWEGGIHGMTKQFESALVKASHDHILGAHMNKHTLLSNVMEGRLYVLLLVYMYLSNEVHWFSQLVLVTIRCYAML